MRWLLDENISATVARALREAGHDVLTVKEGMRGKEDVTILARAQLEARIVVTQDKDFGELAFRFLLPAESGVILFRLSGADPESDNRRILQALTSRSDWAGHFSVITEERARMRLLPRQRP